MTQQSEDDSPTPIEGGPRAWFSGVLGEGPRNDGIHRIAKEMHPAAREVLAPLENRLDAPALERLLAPLRAAFPGGFSPLHRDIDLLLPAGPAHRACLGGGERACAPRFAAGGAIMTLFALDGFVEVELDDHAILRAPARGMRSPENFARRLLAQLTPFLAGTGLLQAFTTPHAAHTFADALRELRAGREAERVLFPDLASRLDRIVWDALRVADGPLDPRAWQLSLQPLIATLQRLEDRLLAVELAPPLARPLYTALTPATSPIGMGPLRGREGTPPATGQASVTLVHASSARALRHLAPSGGADLLYLDPPYNTANGERTYADARAGAAWSALFAGTLGALEPARREDSLLFTSIDDNEVSRARLLLPEAGWQERSTVIVKMSETSGVKMRHADRILPRLKEYLLIHGGPAARLQVPRVPKSRESLASYVRYYVRMIENPNDAPEDWRLVDVRDAAQAAGIDPADEDALLDFRIAHASRLVYRTNSRFATRWRRENPDAPAIVRTTSPRGVPYILWDDKQLLRLSDFLDEPLGDLWLDISTINLRRETFGVAVYRGGQKPMALLERILDCVPATDPIVLDPFAGSGTSGQALLARGRGRALLIERDPEAFSLAVRRLGRARKRHGGGLRALALVPVADVAEALGEVSASSGVGTGPAARSASPVAPGPDARGTAVGDFVAAGPGEAPGPDSTASTTFPPAPNQIRLGKSLRWEVGPIEEPSRCALPDGSPIDVVASAALRLGMVPVDPPRAWRGVIHKAVEEVVASPREELGLGGSDTADAASGAAPRAHSGGALSRASSEIPDDAPPLEVFALQPEEGGGLHAWLVCWSTHRADLVRVAALVRSLTDEAEVIVNASERLPADIHAGAPLRSLERLLEGGQAR